MEDKHKHKHKHMRVLVAGRARTAGQLARQAAEVESAPDDAKRRWPAIADDQEAGRIAPYTQKGKSAVGGVCRLHRALDQRSGETGQKQAEYLADIAQSVSPN